MSSRRDFLKTALGASIVAAAAPIVCACGENAYAQGVPDGPLGTIVLDLSLPAFSKLAAANGSVNYTLPSPNTTLKMVITRIDDTTFSVLAGKCTHQGYTLTPYDPAPAKQYIYCANHKSKFGLDGKVIPGVGPATVALKSYSHVYDSAANTLTITDTVIKEPVNDVSANQTTSLVLEQNYPNPASSKTMIPFSTPVDGSVQLIVSDGLGKQIAELHNGFIAAGQHQIEFNASALAAGTYFYKLMTANGTLIKQMIVQ